DMSDHRRYRSAFGAVFLLGTMASVSWAQSSRGGRDESGRTGRGDEPRASSDRAGAPKAGGPGTGRTAGHGGKPRQGARVGRKRLRDRLSNLEGGAQMGELLALEPIREELRLSERQLTWAKEMPDVMWDRRRELLAAVRESGGTGRDQLLMSAQILRQESNEAIGRFLRPEQRRRRTQITLQSERPLASATEPDLASSLNLSPEQIVQVQEVLKQLRSDQAPINTMPRQLSWDLQKQDRRDRAKIVAQLADCDAESEQLRQVAVARIGRILTRRQRSSFNKMLGKPFDLSKLDTEHDSVERRKSPRPNSPN